MERIVESITYDNSTICALQYANNFNFCTEKTSLLKQTLRPLFQDRSFLRIAAQK